MQRALWGFRRSGQRLGEQDWVASAAGRGLEDGGTWGKGVEPLPGDCPEAVVRRSEARRVVADR